MDSQGEGPKQQGLKLQSNRGSPPPDACLSQRRRLGCTTCGGERAPGVGQIFQLSEQYLRVSAPGVRQIFQLMKQYRTEKFVALREKVHFAPWDRFFYFLFLIYGRFHK